MSLENGLICVMKCEDGYTHLTVHMECIQTPRTPGVNFYINGYNLKTGVKGFHVHETGNLENGCETLGPHYNPTNKTHGGLNDRNAHHGDLGNLVVDEDGDSQTQICSNLLSLRELLGRSLVLHSKRDDLGRGSNEESKLTGNSGSRICCGVIGYS